MMDEFTGSILEINKKHAIVMTDSCDFVTIHRQPQMFVGQQVKFRKSDIAGTNKNYIKYATLAASVFIIALFSVFYFQIFMPSTVFAYVDVDINPSVEFSIDKNAQVLDLVPLNTDAQSLLKDLELVDLPLKEAITEVVKASKQQGFISTSKQNTVLISASINHEKNHNTNDTDEKAFDKIISDISRVTFNVGTENIDPEILKVTPENRESAIKNNLSMGRYALYSKIKADDNNITVEIAKTEHISDMLDKAKIKGSKKIKSNESNSKGSKTKDTNSKNSDSKINNSKSSNPKNNDHKINNSNNTVYKNKDPKNTGNSNSKETASNSTKSKKKYSQNTNSESSDPKNNNSKSSNPKNNNPKNTNSNSMNNDSKDTNSNSEKNDSKNNNFKNDASTKAGSNNSGKGNSSDSTLTDNKKKDNSDSTDKKNILTNNNTENNSSNNEHAVGSGNSEKGKIDK